MLVGDSKEVTYPLLPGVVPTGIAVMAVPARPLHCSRRMVPLAAQGTAWAWAGAGLNRASKRVYFLVPARVTRPRVVMRSRAPRFRRVSLEAVRGRVGCLDI